MRGRALGAPLLPHHALARRLADWASQVPDGCGRHQRLGEYGDNGRSGEPAPSGQGVLPAQRAQQDAGEVAAHMHAQGEGQGVQAQDGPGGHHSEEKLLRDLNGVGGGGGMRGDPGGQVHDDESQGCGPQGEPAPELRPQGLEQAAAQ